MYLYIYLYVDSKYNQDSKKDTANTNNYTPLNLVFTQIKTVVATLFGNVWMLVNQVPIEDTYFAT